MADVSQTEEISLSVVVSASTIELAAEARVNGSQAQLEGKVVGANYTARTLVVGATTVVVPADAPITNGFRELELEDVIVGARIHVKGSAATGTTITATSIIVQQTAPPPPPPPPTTDAGAIRFTNAGYSRAENVGNAAIQVERTSGDDGAVGVSFTTTNGTAAAGQDYTAAAGTLNWADGEDGVKTFNVAVANFPFDEGWVGGCTIGTPLPSACTTRIVPRGAGGPAAVGCS